jgi:hypothetical protein
MMQVRHSLRGATFGTMPAWKIVAVVVAGIVAGQVVYVSLRGLNLPLAALLDLVATIAVGWVVARLLGLMPTRGGGE